MKSSFRSYLNGARQSVLIISRPLKFESIRYGQIEKGECAAASASNRLCKFQKFPPNFEW